MNATFDTLTGSLSSSLAIFGLPGGMEWIVILVIGLLIPMIDTWAHMGGFAGGYLAARILDPLKDETSKHYLVALACLVMTFASIVASFLHGAPLFQ